MQQGLAATCKGCRSERTQSIRLWRREEEQERSCSDSCWSPTDPRDVTARDDTGLTRQPIGTYHEKRGANPGVNVYVH